MSTRLVVKNLPSWITEEKLREYFEQKGNLTDCSLKYTSKGKSRRFAFIGYATQEAANQALEYFDNSCIGSSRVKVEICKDLPTPAVSLSVTPNQQSAKESIIPADIANDPKFKEFIGLQSSDSKAWSNENGANAQISTFLSDETNNDSGTRTDKKANTQKEEFTDSAVEDSYASTVKLKNLPPNTSKKQIEQFFCGMEIKRILLGLKNSTTAHVEFSNKKFVDDALRRSKNFLKGKKIIVMKAMKTTSTKESQELSLKQQAKYHSIVKQQPRVDLSDSGRLFIRNLSYLCTEDDIQNMFSKYGDLNEVYLPLDKTTKQNKGYAFVSYLMPEHAVKALNALDGTTFQGRMLHLIPAETKPEPEKEIENAGSSYKTEKEAALKKSAGSSHNWNALFVGTNAIVENVAQDYGKTAVN